MTTTPSVLFVCVKNGGKSQIAAGLMRQAAGTTIAVESAGRRRRPPRQREHRATRHRPGHRSGR